MKLGGEPLAVLDLILPYQKVEGLSELAYVTFQARDPVDRELHPLTIKMMPKQGWNPGKRIDAFNGLYQVEDRWDRGRWEKAVLDGA